MDVSCCHQTWCALPLTLPFDALSSKCNLKIRYKTVCWGKQCLSVVSPGWRFMRVHSPVCLTWSWCNIQEVISSWVEWCFVCFLVTVRSEMWQCLCYRNNMADTHGLTELWIVIGQVCFIFGWFSASQCWCLPLCHFIFYLLDCLHWRLPSSLLGWRCSPACGPRDVVLINLPDCTLIKLPVNGPAPCFLSWSAPGWQHP